MASQRTGAGGVRGKHGAARRGGGARAKNSLLGGSRHAEKLETSFPVNDFSDFPKIFRFPPFSKVAGRPGKLLDRQHRQALVKTWDQASWNGQFQGHKFPSHRAVLQPTALMYNFSVISRCKTVTLCPASFNAVLWSLFKATQPPNSHNCRRQVLSH